MLAWDRHVLAHNFVFVLIRTNQNELQLNHDSNIDIRTWTNFSVLLFGFSIFAVYFCFFHFFVVVHYSERSEAAEGRPKAARTTALGNWDDGNEQKFLKTTTDDGRTTTTKSDTILRCDSRNFFIFLQFQFFFVYVFLRFFSNFFSMNLTVKIWNFFRIFVDWKRLWNGQNFFYTQKWLKIVLELKRLARAHLALILLKEL